MGKGVRKGKGWGKWKKKVKFLITTKLLLLIRDKKETCMLYKLKEFINKHLKRSKIIKLNQKIILFFYFLFIILSYYILLFFDKNKKFSQ
jgi:hypothetical protein